MVGVPFRVPRRHGDVPGTQAFVPTGVNARVTNTVSVTGSVTASITGSVTVSTLPNPVTVSGTVTVSGITATASVLVTNFPASQTVSGTVTTTPVLATTFTTSQVSITESATQIFAAAALTTYRAVTNTSTASIVYLGTSAVTTTSGYPLGPGQVFSMANQSGALFGIVGALATTSIGTFGWT